MMFISSARELARLRDTIEALQQENNRLRHMAEQLDRIVQDACDEAWDGWRRADLRAKAVAAGSVVLFPGGKQT